MYKRDEKIIGGILSKEFDKRFEVWKDVYYELYNLIEKDGIFSKLPNRIMIRAYYTREYASLFEHVLNFFKNHFVIPALLFWRIFLIKFKCLYYKDKYSEVSMLKNIKDEDFDFLFVLNTRDHIITALPVLERMDEMGKKILIVTFKEVYSKYMEDFDNLKNANILLFEYELKNLPIKKYIEILAKSTENFKLLKSYEMNADIKEVIRVDKNFVKLHLKEELIQYHFFKKIFDSFDLKGVISIVLTTAFGIAKERDIPTFILQHGIGGGGLYPYTDYIIAYDEQTKDELKRWTDGAVTVLPLGAPRFEYSKKVASLKRNISNYNKKIGCSGYKKNVTYISTDYARYENKKLLLALKKLREKIPDDVNFIIKLHPRENLKVFNFKEEIEDVFSQKDLKKTTFIKKEQDFYEILANSDVVISTDSTGIWESIAMDIPVIQVNFTGQSYPTQVDLASFGWKEPISDPDVMVSDVLSILSDEGRCEEVIEKQKWLKKRMFKNFGNCGKVIAETIVSICENTGGGV